MMVEYAGSSMSGATVAEQSAPEPYALWFSSHAGQP